MREVPTSLNVLSAPHSHNRHLVTRHLKLRRNCKVSWCANQTRRHEISWNPVSAQPRKAINSWRRHRAGIISSLAHSWGRGNRQLRELNWLCRRMWTCKIKVQHDSNRELIPFPLRLPPPSTLLPLSFKPNARGWIGLIRSSTPHTLHQALELLRQYPSGMCRCLMRYLARVQSM